MIDESKTFENFSATVCNVGGKSEKVTTGPSDLFFYSELSIMNAEQNDTSYDVII